MRSAFSIASVMAICVLMLVQAEIPGAAAYSVEQIDGSSEASLAFGTAGSRTVNITLEPQMALLSARMNVSGHPSGTDGQSYPLDVSVDVGDDGTTEWAFGGTGYGPLGMQDRLSNSALSKEFMVSDGSSAALEVLLPANATVEKAELLVTGIPTSQENASNKFNGQRIGPGEPLNYTVTGISGTDIVVGSSVVLEDAAMVYVQKAIDQDVYNLTNWVTTSTYLGQSFVINNSDPRLQSVDLYNIEVAIDPQTFTDLGLTMDIIVGSAANDYKPQGIPIATTSVDENAVSNDHINFTFQPAVLLQTGKVYAFRVKGTGGSDNPIVRFDNRTGGTNVNSKYPVAGCYMHVSSDSGVNWNTYHNHDLSFGVYVQAARHLQGSEKQNVLVDGKPPTSSNATDLSYDVTPRYNSTGWTFEVRTDGANDILFNVTGQISFYDAPDHVGIDIGQNGTKEFYYAGNLTGPMAVMGLEHAFMDALRAASTQGKGNTDLYGNKMVPVKFNASANGKGKLKVNSLRFEYNFNASVPGIKPAIEAYTDAHGTHIVPVKVAAGSQGLVLLSGLDVVFDGAPRPGAIPKDLAVPEEGTNASLLDIQALFTDDYDDTLTLSIHNVTSAGAQPGTVNASITAGGMLSLDLRKALNWSGRAVIFLDATDDNGFTSTAGPVNISVPGVNDAPFITSAPPANASAGSEWRYDFAFVDSDSTTFTMWLEKAPLTMDLDRANKTLIWTPGTVHIGTYNFLLKVSDGSIAGVQNITLTVGPYTGGTNSPPLVQDVTDRRLAVGENLSVQISAFDPDLDTINYSLVTGPAGLEINGTNGLVTWRPDKAGNYSVTFRVSDGNLWVDKAFNVTVTEKNTTIEKPSVTIDRPTSGEKVSGPLTIIGRASSKASKVVKVEYCIDDGPWTGANLQTDGTWSAEASTKELKKGSHTLVVRATDAAGQKSQTYTTFEVKAKGNGGTPTAFTDLQGLSYLLLLVAIIAAIIAGVALSRKKGKAKGKGAGKGAVSERSGKATKAAATPKAASSAQEKEGRADIESAFLVYHDGRLVTYSSRSEIADLDATIQVIKDFVKASFRGDVGRLDSLRYENMNVILERGIQMYLVVVTPEEEDVALQGLRRKVRRFLGDVHERYRHILKVWDGKYKSVKPIEKMVEDLVKGHWAPSGGKASIDDDERPDAKDKKAQRWDESPDLEDDGMSKVEKRKALQDKLTRGEITEDEFEKLSSKLK